MKAKLKKERDGDYTLALNNPKEYPHSLPLLSKQNCDEIFGIFDVEKLANEFSHNVCGRSAYAGMIFKFERFPKVDDEGYLIIKKAK